MKRYYTLALRELSAQKVTSFLIFIAVVLSTMMTAAVGQSAGVLAAMRAQQAIALGGDRYATFIQLTGDQAAMLEQDPRFSYTGRCVLLGSLELNSLLSLSLMEYWDNGAAWPMVTQLTEGRLPEAPLEIALPEDALQLLGFTGKTGDSIRLSLSKSLRHGLSIDAYDYEAEFTLVGITRSNYLGYTSGSIRGLAGRGTAEALLPAGYLYYNMDIRTADKRTFQRTVDDINQTLALHELDTLYNLPYLNALGISATGQEDTGMLDDSGYPFLILAGALVAALVLLAAGLVIYNVLKIAASRRRGQYGVLRAIGAERGQLYIICAAEVLVLCAVGIPAGLLLGWLSAEGILTAVLNQISPEMFLTQDTEQLQALIAANSSGKPLHLLFSSGVTLIFAFLAAAPAARFAARVSPVAAMYGHAVRIKRKNRRIKRIRNFERCYAWLNLRRSRGRTAITVLSLVMSITVFITLQSVLTRLSVSKDLPDHLGDYSIVNAAVGFSPEELAALEAGENVAFVAAEQCVSYQLDEQHRPAGIETDLILTPGESFQIYGMNDRWLEDQFSQSPELLEALKAGEGCVIRNPIPMEIGGAAYFTSHIGEGETVVIAGKSLPVLRAMSGYDGYFSVGSSGFANGIQVLVSDRLFSQLTGVTSYAELRPGLAETADRTAFDALLDQLCQRLPGTTVVSYEQTDQQLRESEAQIQLLAWGLILFIGLIGILNIVNTVYTNIHTRTAETGIQRAIGMSVDGLCRTFLWEGAFYGLTASVLGAAAGYGCTLLVDAGTTGELSLLPFPLLPALEAAGFSAAACLMATALPLRKLAGLNIVEAIHAVE